VKKFEYFCSTKNKNMGQTYHANAKTNVTIRTLIKNSTESSESLSARFGVSINTIKKWEGRIQLTDKSSAPIHIEYALSELTRALIVGIRSSTWLPLDEILDMVSTDENPISRSSTYRLFVKEKINTVPQEKKDKAHKFKAYEPGYLHIDVTYLPKFNGLNSYLYVAIDRATRLMYFAVYQNKTAENAQIFMDNCLDFFPFLITHVLTDNGLEFTNRLIMSKKGNLCTKPSLLDVKCKKNNIDHRLTKPSSPKTNGMVERVNGTIKTNTILKNEYQNTVEMNKDLIAFLCFYNLYRRHGSLRKELKVKTPLNAVKKWYDLKPEIFREKPEILHQKLINLQKQNNQILTTTL
jgi:transposase-like protein